MASLKFLKYFYEKNIKYFINILTIFLALVGIWNLYYLTEISPRSNDECLWSPVDHETLEFEFVKFEGVSWNAGIRDGDILVAVEDVKIKNKAALAQFLINQIPEGDSALYTVSRQGKIFDTMVVIKKVYDFKGISLVLLGVIWLIVGYIVIMAKPFGSVQRIFFWLGFALVLGATSSFQDLSPGNLKDGIVDSPLNSIIDITWILGLSFIPFLFLHFFWVFPKPNSFIKNKWTLRSIYLAAIITFVSALFYRFNSATIPDVYFTLFSFLGGIALIGTLVGLVSLFVSYIALTSKTERNSIFVILLSYTLGFVALVYYFALNFMSEGTALEYNEPAFFMPILIVVLLPLSFSYSIFKYSLMDVTEVVKNAIMYTTATLLIAGIYFFLMYIIGQGISEAIGTEYQAIIAGAIFIGFAFVFQSTKDRFQRLLTEKFYPEQFAFQKILMKFSNDVSSVVGLENILDSVQDTFATSLKLNKVGLLLKTNDGSSCELRRSLGVDVDEIKLHSHEENIQDTLIEKEKIGYLPVFEQSDFENVFNSKSAIFKKSGIFTIIPLRVKNKIIGLVLFGLKQSGAQFAGKDLELLVTAANQIALAIENARLYESEAEKLKIDRDLENAKRIQKTLLPGCLPDMGELDICGVMEPAMLVGGDYFDLIKVSHNKLFVVVGDVSGKGLAASFYMSKLQTMMRLFCDELSDPKKVLTEINRRIYQDIEKNWFITVALGLFDTEKSTLTFCRAGHTPLYKINENSIEEFLPKGIGVGIDPGDIFDSTLEQISIPVYSNDLFAFYSDGLTEAMDDKMVMYGVEQLKKIMSSNLSETSNHIQNEIMASVQRFRKGAQQNDDITLVLVKAK